MAAFVTLPSLPSFAPAAPERRAPTGGNVAPMPDGEQSEHRTEADPDKPEADQAEAAPAADEPEPEDESKADEPEDRAETEAEPDEAEAAAGPMFSGYGIASAVLGVL